MTQSISIPDAMCCECALSEYNNCNVPVCVCNRMDNSQLFALVPFRMDYAAYSFSLLAIAAAHDKVINFTRGKNEKENVFRMNNNFVSSYFLVFLTHRTAFH